MQFQNLDLGFYFEHDSDTPVLLSFEQVLSFILSCGQAVTKENLRVLHEKIFNSASFFCNFYSIHRRLFKRIQTDRIRDPVFRMIIRIFFADLERRVDTRRDAVSLKRSRPLLTYRLTGEWGRATDTGFQDGQTVAKATWKHLKGTV
jgi:hypothetical protein